MIRFCGLKTISRYILSAAKENSHNKCMGKSDFHSINQAIACALEDSQVVVKRGVGDQRLHLFNDRHSRWEREQGRWRGRKGV